MLRWFSCCFCFLHPRIQSFDIGLRTRRRSEERRCLDASSWIAYWHESPWEYLLWAKPYDLSTMARCLRIEKISKIVPIDGCCTQFRGVLFSGDPGQRAFMELYSVTTLDPKPFRVDRHIVIYCAVADFSLPHISRNSDADPSFLSCWSMLKELAVTFTIRAYWF